MSRNNTPQTGPILTVREAATALISAIDETDQVRALPIEITDASEALTAALAQPEPSRPGELPEVALAVETMGAMKDGRPVSSEGVRAIVALAEIGVEQLRQFDVRWEADMRAVKRWQAGDDLPTMHRALLEQAKEEIEAAASNYASENNGDGYRGASKLAREIEEALSQSLPEKRGIIWPDHADLVVWLMTVLDRPVAYPTIADLSALRARLAQAILASGGNPLAKDANTMLGQMAEALSASERARFVAVERARGMETDLAKAGALLADAAMRLRTDEDDDRGHGDMLASCDPEGAAVHFLKADERADIAHRIEQFVGVAA